MPPGLKICRFYIACATAILGTNLSVTLPTIAQAQPQTEHRYTTHAPITAVEAKALSAPQYKGGRGKVVLLFGGDFDKNYLKSIIENIESYGYPVTAYSGGERPNHLQLFIAGGELPGFIEERDAWLTLGPTVRTIIIQRKLNVFSNKN